MGGGVREHSPFPRTASSGGFNDSVDWESETLRICKMPEELLDSALITLFCAVIAVNLLKGIGGDTESRHEDGDVIS